METHRSTPPAWSIILLMFTLQLSTVRANQVDGSQASQPVETTLASTIDRALAFLESSQTADGSWSGQLGPGVTALVATGIMRHGRGKNDPMIAKALDYIKTNIRTDGGIYGEGTLYRNYETCIAILCLSEANQDGRHDQILRRAEQLVKQLQWTERQGHDLSSLNHGGAGYGKHQRPDMSNTTFLVEALKSLGRGSEDPAMQKALTFISRCQNLETEHNETKYAALNPDGGFYYTIAAGGSSQAGPTPNGGLRSYGSMTYAGLRSMIYAGVGSDDPRVQAAYRWAKDHYTLNENPGLGSAGHFYYLHTLAKALDAIGKEILVDHQGIEHKWRHELVMQLSATQQPNGCWTNENRRWLEGDPNLATGYALLALAYCQK
jgi:squalene-hopene cyclase-like protein